MKLFKIMLILKKHKVLIINTNWELTKNALKANNVYNSSGFGAKSKINKYSERLFLTE